MANNVHYSVNLDLDAGQIALLEKTMKAVETEQGEMKWKSWTAEDLPIYPVSYNEDDWYNWSCENIGAKWCHIEEYADDYISGYSAWSPPIPLVENLVQYIHDQVGGDVSAKLTYEDEFRNFIGVWQNDDFEELDGEDLVSVFENKYRVNVSGDDFDWSDYDENTEACYDELFDGLVHEWFDEVQV